ncbi:MAG: restriction endonuclease [Firmicutes bacterium ML8_F2]|jgi:hypothetical protein|nr:MAG: restriction endonuclease [Firmicutes bacterium ML8_F2]
MGINLDKPQHWKEDIALSVDLYNDWFLKFAPSTYRKERRKATAKVEDMLKKSNYLKNLSARELQNHPSILFALRMCTAPPIARDRLVGLAKVSKNLVNNMEIEGRVPPRMAQDKLNEGLSKISAMIIRLADHDIFPWLKDDREPSSKEIYRAATIVADRLCGSNSDPIIRNAQEKRQLDKIKSWLELYGYKDVTSKSNLNNLKTGEFALRLNAYGLKEDNKPINVPVDVAIKKRQKEKTSDKDMVLIEAKSAGDFTNTNKRRKEEATKFAQLRRKYGTQIQYILFLCGYFGSEYLGYEAAEGIDWVWEHRMDDLNLVL